MGLLLVFSFFVPLPLGTLRVALGLSVLVCASLPFALFIQGCRRKYGWLNQRLMWMEDKFGQRWAGNLMMTRPENDPRSYFFGKAKVENSKTDDKA